MQNGGGFTHAQESGDDVGWHCFGNFHAGTLLT
jgi:hypothetical protein